MLGESVRNKSAYLPGPTWALFDYHECRNLGLWCHFQHPANRGTGMEGGDPPEGDMDLARSGGAPAPEQHVHATEIAVPKIPGYVHQGHAD